jgi:hypothetical protein
MLKIMALLTVDSHETNVVLFHNITELTKGGPKSQSTKRQREKSHYILAYTFFLFFWKKLNVKSVDKHNCN